MLPYWYQNTNIPHNIKIQQQNFVKKFQCKSLLVTSLVAKRKIALCQAIAVNYLESGSSQHSQFYIGLFSLDVYVMRTTRSLKYIDYVVCNVQILMKIFRKHFSRPLSKAVSGLLKAEIASTCKLRRGQWVKCFQLPADIHVSTSNCRHPDGAYASSKNERHNAIKFAHFEVFCATVNSIEEFLHDAWMMVFCRYCY